MWAILKIDRKQIFLLKKDLEQKLNSNVKIHYIDHHLSHIASAYYPSGLEEAVGLSIDGFGDFASICIAKLC